ncbi:DUF6660 family protein [Spirosoma sp.]|jgi:hypothetical protein|uniref:DUF6660 family protein n=1 Tax=unclassified Spirosoma TaxID=2621999 RepID=UPI00343E4E7D
MKSLFYSLLCAYMLLLSVLPCTDSFALARTDKQQTAIAADLHQHPLHQAIGDSCSPLCVCSCCGTVLESLPAFAFGFRPLTIWQTACFGSINTHWLSPSLTNWQPPLLG